MNTHPTQAAPDQNPEAVREAVWQFLARYVDDAARLDQVCLISGGLLDSLAAVELLAYLERRFGLEVRDEDLDIENFDSVAAITAFIGRKGAT